MSRFEEYLEAVRSVVEIEEISEGTVKEEKAKRQTLMKQVEDEFNNRSDVKERYNSPVKISGGYLSFAPKGLIAKNWKVTTNNKNPHVSLFRDLNMGTYAMRIFGAERYSKTAKGVVDWLVKDYDKYDKELKEQKK